MPAARALWSAADLASNAAIAVDGSSRSKVGSRDAFGLDSFDLGADLGRDERMAIVGYGVAGPRGAAGIGNLGRVGGRHGKQGGFDFRRPLADSGLQVGRQDTRRRGFELAI